MLAFLALLERKQTFALETNAEVASEDRLVVKAVLNSSLNCCTVYSFL
jgi:hypothetical protein